VTRQRSALFVLLAYVTAGLLLEVAHHDDIMSGPGAQLAVKSHDCGTHEIHISLDSLHPCLACFQSSQRVSIPAQSFIPTAEMTVSPTMIPSLDEQFLSTDYLSTGKRGPPLL